MVFLFQSLCFFFLVSYFFCLMKIYMISGYSGVICGMDPVCCESSSWRESACIDKLTRGSNQPFYQVPYAFFSILNLTT